MTTNFNSKRFKVSNMKTAKEIILTPDDSTTDERWKSETEWFQKEFSKLLYESMKFLQPVYNVVDFGCGIGRVIKGLKDEIPNCMFTGIDSSGEMRELAVEYLDDTQVNITGGFYMIPDSSVDMILCVYSLQHVHKGELMGIMREFRRILKPTGRLYLLNLKGRCVPIDTMEESAASDPHELNEAISSVARNPDGAWENDGINLPSLLSSMFNHSEPIELPDKYFTKLTKGSHDSIMYKGIKK